MEIITYPFSLLIVGTLVTVLSFFLKLMQMKPWKDESTSSNRHDYNGTNNYASKDYVKIIDLDKRLSILENSLARLNEKLESMNHVVEHDITEIERELRNIREEHNKYMTETVKYHSDVKYIQEQLKNNS